MGTQIEIYIFDISNTYSTNIVEQDIQQGFTLFHENEKEFSRFLEESSLSRLNTHKTLEVSENFQKVIELSQKFYDMTAGYFNPCVRVKDIGYDKDFDRLPKTQPGTNKILPLQSYNPHNIIRDQNKVTLPGRMELDFGGIVKGYTVDMLRDVLREKGYNNFLINAGGDIFMSGKTDEGKRCIVGIDSPLGEEKFLATVELENTSLSTSGSYKRNWNIGKKNYHHIVNPYQKESPQEIVSITLLAEDCTITDTLATACLAMGLVKTKQFLKEKNIPACIYLRDGTCETLGDWEEKLQIIL